eukprot:m.105811 g.105811  ORF g.105811 m.105811 type:complete len:521 (+) comp27678_c0_seq1:64-1626(+)
MVARSCSCAKALPLPTMLDFMIRVVSCVLYMTTILIPTTAMDAIPPPIIVDVNHNSPTKRFNFQFGADHGPSCDVPAGAPPINVATELLAMGATFIRTHDSGVLDWPVIFPHSLSLENGATTPDTTDPSNYVWTQADAYYSGIVKGGLQPYFRLGTSWGQLGGGLPPANIPYNRTALVDILLHTVRHYNEGWGGGENFSAIAKTQYWEVWNEPDGIPRFWNRSFDDFHVLIAEAITTIKHYDPTLIVGADGCAVVEAPTSAPFSFGLMSYLAQHNVSFDFFSWHAYTDNTDLFTSIATDVRSHLDALGLTHVKQHITEWFPCILCHEQDTAMGAASVGATLTKMVNAGVSIGIMYPLCSSDEGNKTGGVGWGLFDSYTQPGKAVWRPLTYTLAEFGEMMQSTPLQLETTLTPSSTTTTTALAATTDANACSASVKVMLSSQKSNATRATVNVIDLPRSFAGSAWKYSVLVTNATEMQALVLSGSQQPNNATGTVSIEFDFVSPAVAFVRFDLQSDLCDTN